MALFDLFSSKKSDDSFTDPRDGKVYKTVKIGRQVWFAENLNFDAGKGCWYYKSRPEFGEKYGRLYNWETAMKNCPKGWHIPTDVEWKRLTDILGGTDIAGGKLKEAGTENWISPNKGATNESGFSALPGGKRDSGKFKDIGVYGEWWSSTEAYVGDACYRGLSTHYIHVFYHGGCDKKSGLSVRCLKD